MVVEFAASAVKSAIRAIESVAPAIESAVGASIVVEIVPVIEGVAPRVVPVMVVNYVAVAPIKSPMMPAPPITAVPADSETRSE
jgi:hypothetical protein